jgi:geranylgeranyl pyrophosphate synthase
MQPSSKFPPLLEPIRPHLEQVERLLHERSAQVDEPLRTMLRHSLDGGKRIRPALVILTGQVFDSPLASFYPLAAAVDMLHAATLIHDDLVDKAPLRRGRQTLHTIWPTAATVLAGDYLLGEATALIAGLAHPRILKIFGEILRTMCAGEIRRMLAARGEHDPRQDYYRSIEAKTASLFAATTEMAAVLAGAEESHVAALRHFGQELGLAFQIVDDVLDLAGDEAQLGKPAGNDLRQGLITLPVLHYLEQAENASPVSAVLAGQRDEEHLLAAIEAVRSSGAIQAALEEAWTHARSSQEALTTLPDSASCQALRTLAEYVVERER